MKITVIFTGGTIGSAAQNGWISPDGGRAGLLIENYRKIYGDTVEFEYKHPYTCLSENITAERLNLLLDCVKESLAEDTCGVIVTHGTDTLQYTAEFLALGLGRPEKSVCIVSSNYPLDDKRANGNVNFAAAVAMVREGHGGVFVPYRNSDGRVHVHFAARLLRHGEFTDDVECFGHPFARFANGYLDLTGEQYPECEAVENVCLADASQVLTVVCRPCDGFNYSLHNVKAVLMLPYHSGTMNTENENFKYFCYKCRCSNR